MDEKKICVSDVLPCGEENAIRLRQLMAILKLSGRTIRKLIEQERRAGSLICSGENGYFLAADTYEAKKFAQSMRRRATEILKTVEAVERAAAEGV